MTDAELEAAVEASLASLTVAQRLALMTFLDIFHTAGLPEAGLPTLKVSDGPVGVRGEFFSVGPPSSLFPCPTALGASFDTGLVERVGAAIGAEARRKGVDVVFAPTINLHRTPLGGRNFECYSEDPFLTGELAAAFVRGVQANGVAATPKHFVANETELHRSTTSSDVDERTLREVYLPPFRKALVDAGAWAVMAAYNRLNGTPCTEDGDLLTTILRHEWGWDGTVISDCWAVGSTVPAALAGLDVEMPGPPDWFGKALAEAVDGGAVPTAVVDEAARRVLRLHHRVGRGPGGAIEHPETAAPDGLDQALAFDAAVSGTVLLHNDGVLPLAAGTPVAVIGPRAAATSAQGGGSARIRPVHVVSVLDAVRGRAEGPVTHAVGCDDGEPIPALEVGRHAIGAGITVEYFEEDGAEPILVETVGRLHMVWWGPAPGGLTGKQFRVRAHCRFTPATTGSHRFLLAAAGHATLAVDGEPVVASTRSLRIEEAIFATVADDTATVDLDAGRAYDVTVEYRSAGRRTVRALLAACVEPRPADEIATAAAVAARAAVPVVVVGTTPAIETESRDRTSIDLPGAQADLVRAVVAANPRTVVVVNSGAPVDLTCADGAAAVVQAWFPGQEAGAAIAAVLFGDREPGGRLPTTFPHSIAALPIVPPVPEAGGHIAYGEGVLVGHRGYEAAGIAPRYPFGHGLTYTTFSYGPPAVTPTNDGWRVTVPVTNTGERDGSEVVQAYLAAPGLGGGRPPQWFAGWDRVQPSPGHSATATIDISRDQVAVWDVAAHAWRIDPGPYEIRIGASSAAATAVVTVTVD